MTVVDGSPNAPVLDRVKGQPDALRVLRGSLPAPLHAYLFIGPPGTGRREASIAFAAALLCPNGGCGKCPSCVEALAGRHPDLTVTERVGASILVRQAQDVANMALRTPRVARYQVLVLVDFDLVDEAAPVLLKTLEEPPETTVIIITGETVPASFRDDRQQVRAGAIQAARGRVHHRGPDGRGRRGGERDICRRGRPWAP